MNKWIIILMLTGCTMDASVVHDDKHMVCTDTRDGETFSFENRTAHNARMGIGTESSVDIVDDSGRTRTLTKSMEAYWKCEEIK